MKLHLVLVVVLAEAVCAQTRVRGTAVDATSGAPLEGIEVSLDGEMAQQDRYRGKTDARGAFSFDGVKPGRYVLRVSFEGYREAEDSGYVVVGAHGIVTPLSVKLVRTASIGGVVQDDEERPIANCKVLLLDPHRLAGVPMMRPVATATTGADGKFRFADVVPGTYYLQAVPAATKRNHGEPQLIPTYYPSSKDAAGAGELALLPAADLEGLRLKLRKSAVYQVSGRVVGVNAPAQLRILLMPAATGSSDIPDGLLHPALPGPDAGVQPDGSFSVEGVSPGWYVAIALDSRIGAIRASTGFLVKDADIDELRVIAAPAVTFAGKVVYDGGESARRPHRFRMMSDGGSGFRMADTEMSKDGTFAATDLPSGRYRLIYEEPWSVVKVAFGGATVTGARIDLIGSAEDVVVTLTANSARLTGRIEGDFRLESPARGTITAIPIPTTIAEITGLRTAAIDPAGSFAVGGLGPETYRVCAWRETGHQPVEVLAHPALQQRLDAGCIKVTLKPGEVQHVTLKQISTSAFEQ